MVERLSGLHYLLPAHYTLSLSPSVGGVPGAANNAILGEGFCPATPPHLEGCLWTGLVVIILVL